MAKRRVAVLKVDDFRRYGAEHHGRLPYRMDVLRQHGWTLRWTDRHLSWPFANGRIARLVRKIESATTPFVQTLLLLPQIVRSDTVLAMFESQGHAFALLRRMGLFRRKHVVIVACWLAELVRQDGSRRRRLYRFLYRGVDTIVVFSENQRVLLVEALGVAPGAIAVVPFGVDHSEWDGVEVRDDGPIVAIGRDEGRDWPTLVEAVRGTECRITIASRPRSLAGLDLPVEIEFVGYLPRDSYRRLLASASIVLVVSKDLAYPTGQTVLLEALGLGKPCIVTRTAAMDAYTRAGTVLVEPGDVDGLRAAIVSLAADSAERAQLAQAARNTRAQFDTSALWNAVAEAVEERAVPLKNGR